jgi:hypothetical protein
MFLRKGTEGLIFHNHNLESPEAVHQLFDQHPATEVGEPAPVVVGNAPGLVFDYLSPEPNDLFFAPGMDRGTLQAPFDYPYRVWVVDVDGTPVTISFADQPSMFDQRVVAAERMVMSIAWDDLG